MQLVSMLAYQGQGRPQNFRQALLLLLPSQQPTSCPPSTIKSPYDGTLS